MYTLVRKLPPALVSIRMLPSHCTDVNFDSPTAINRSHCGKEDARELVKRLPYRVEEESRLALTEHFFKTMDVNVNLLLEECLECIVLIHFIFT